MQNIVVITTGGTIASVADESAGPGGAHAKVARVPGPALVAGLAAERLPVGTDVRVVEAMSLNSYDIDFTAMDTIVAAVRGALADPTTIGVVVTHGTDTLEESALLVDLFHDDRRPVVLTGAQRSSDDPGADGPGNLADAIAVAASEEARGLGVLVCFAGLLHAARGTRKIHNTERDAFRDADRGPVGSVHDGRVRIDAVPDRVGRSPLRAVRLAGTRVDTVALYPGADATAIDAHVAHGARGLVLEATGCGNGNAAVVAAVARHAGSGLPIVLSTRVAAGAVRPVYGGGGGGVDLVAAGAVPSGSLRPSQARVLLAALVAAGSAPAAIAAAFAVDPSAPYPVPASAPLVTSPRPTTVVPT